MALFIKAIWFIWMQVARKIDFRLLSAHDLLVGSSSAGEKMEKGQRLEASVDCQLGEGNLVFFKIKQLLDIE